jgi:uncharacterized protein YutE (UPF0331/DUF86 family)
MNEADRQTLAAKLSYLESQLNSLSKYQRRSPATLLRNLERRLAIERLLEIAIQAMIDSSRMLVAAERWQWGNDSRDSLELLVEHRVLDGVLGKRLQKAKAFRNILVHEYVDIDPKRLIEHLHHDLKDIKVYAARVARWLERPSDANEAG